MFYGHVHLNYGMDSPRSQNLGNTTVVNAFERYVAEITTTG